MRRRTRLAATGVGLSAAAVLALAQLLQAGAGAPIRLPVGPGPIRYTVQPQPAPGTCHYRWHGTRPLPDPRCTPGATNPQVTQATTRTTICRAGYTASIRPPLAVTGPEKRANARAYGYRGSLTTGELDHLIPLSLGGDPNDSRNLWLEPNDLPGAVSTRNGKDDLEATLQASVCSGRVTLAAAQAAIARDWTTAARVVPGRPRAPTDPTQLTSLMRHARTQHDVR